MTSLAEPLTTSAPSETLSPADAFVGRKYLQLVLVLGASSAMGPLPIDAYLRPPPPLRPARGGPATRPPRTRALSPAAPAPGRPVVAPLTGAAARPKPLLF